MDKSLKKYFTLALSLDCVVFGFDEEGIKYIDYDLDIKMYPSKRIRVLDRQEYEDHKMRMSYPQDIDDIVMFYMDILKEKLQKNEFPFNDSEIKSYYQLYLNLKSS